MLVLNVYCTVFYYVDGTIAVSYTHLDVYKRQDLNGISEGGYYRDIGVIIYKYGC